MTDELDTRLRTSFSTLDLPIAPLSLFRTRGHLEAGIVEGPPRQRRRWPWLAAAAVLLLPLPIALSTILLLGRPSNQATPPTPTMSTGPSGTGTFEAPGITFDITDGWTDQTASLESPSIPGMRYVGLLAHGIRFCHTVMYSTAPPTPQPTDCSVQADQPGTALLFVMEFTHQFPWSHGDAPPVADSPYPAWGPTSESTSPIWFVQSPDDGRYFLRLAAPSADLDARSQEVTSMLKTFELSSWQPAPDVVDGNVRVETERGFSFDYPAGWTIYYPQDVSMRDAAVVTVASKPLEPPCPGEECQRFTTPAETVAIEFRIGATPGGPDWSTATTTVGGQPAFRQDWGPQNATSAEEGHSWSVRLGDQVLGIGASLRGPGLPELRSAMDDVLDSVSITK